MTGRRNRRRWSRRLRAPVALAATSGLGATLALLGSQGGGSAQCFMLATRARYLRQGRCVRKAISLAELE